MVIYIVGIIREFYKKTAAHNIDHCTISLIVRTPNKEPKIFRLFEGDWHKVKGLGRRLNV